MLVDFLYSRRRQRAYVLGRTGNGGDNWYILKPIIAGPGDRIDTTGNWLVINGLWIAPNATTKRQPRPSASHLARLSNAGAG